MPKLLKTTLPMFFLALFLAMAFPARAQAAFTLDMGGIEGLMNNEWFSAMMSGYAIEADRVEIEAPAGSDWKLGYKTEAAYNQESEPKLFAYLDKRVAANTMNQKITDAKNKTFSLVFKDCILLEDGVWTDLKMTFENIVVWRDMEMSALPFCVIRDGHLPNFTAGTFWADVVPADDTYPDVFAGTTGLQFDVTYTIVGADSSVNFPISYRDIDMPYMKVVGSYRGGMHTQGVYSTLPLASNFPGERIEILSAHVGEGTSQDVIFVDDDYELRISGGNKVFDAKCPTGMEGQPASQKAGIAFIAPNGLKIRWSGSNCGTSSGYTWDWFESVETRVRYRQKDGSWGDWKTLELADRFKYAPYWYQWKRNTPRMENNMTRYGKIYDDPDGYDEDAGYLEVGTHNVMGDEVFSIQVPRKEYTYDFDFNAPEGYGDDDIGNKQADITKLAENKCGASVKSPTLSGYKFLGWNTKADGTGSAWANEEMLSDKTFYARWEAKEYYVDYHANGDTNYSHEAGEFTQNATSGTMARSTFKVDTQGNLTANAFTREGYTFAGWNTKADGSGTAYADQAAVLNWTKTDKKVIDLYAQWTKALGSQTLTVVSEETGNPVAGVTVQLMKLVNGSWQGMNISGTTNAQGQVSVSGLHWFEYKWVCIQAAAGYHKIADDGFAIYPNCSTTSSGPLCTHTSGTRPPNGYGSMAPQGTKVSYMKHFSLALTARVNEVIKGENLPAFFYHIKGTDVAGVVHEYDVMVQCGGNLTGTNRVPDLFAGNYSIKQVPISRYTYTGFAPGAYTVLSAGTVSATAHDIPHGTEASATFSYTMQQVGGFGSMHSVTNRLAQ